MGQSKDINAYYDAADFMDRCLEAPNGGAVTYETEGQAWNFRMRCYTLRTLDKKQNREMYQEGHPLFNRSIYGALSLRLHELPTGKWRVEARHAGEIPTFEEL